jgi:tol-pal system protein YbgF
MNLSRVACIALFVSPVLTFAQKAEIRELQRDMALLQDQVRSLERSFNEKMGSLTTLMQQNIDAVNKLNTSIAVLDASLRDREKSLAAPVTAVGSKVDQMSSEFQGIRVSLEDVSARLGKLERGLVDLGNTIKVIQSPPAPPPGTTAGPPSGLSAEDLYANARRDYASGNYDMALQEFSDYLKYFGDTATAPNAQYYIGELQYSRKEYEAALQAFDLVLEKYPENNKTLDALYMKGRALVQLHRRNDGAEEFRSVIRRAPTSELAAKAKAQLRALGLPISTSRKSSRSPSR